MDDIESFNEADTMESIIFDDDYKKGMEKGMHQAYLKQPRQSPSRSQAYEAGFQHGTEVVARILNSVEDEDEAREAVDQAITNVGRVDSDLEELTRWTEEDRIPIEPVELIKSMQNTTSAATYMEDEDGIPEEYTDPVESNLLEQSLLEERAYGLNFKTYLRNGYAVYLKWLTDKVMRGGLKEDEKEYVYFMVAADINQVAKQNDDDFPMGEDLYAIMLTNTGQRLETELEWDEQEIEDFLSTPHEPKLDLKEFYRRLKNVPVEILDVHSKLVWRGTAGTISGNNKIILKRSDMYLGNPFAPATGFHLGMRMLEVNGFIDKHEDASTPKSITRDIRVE
jgi:hypothetical protein